MGTTKTRATRKAKESGFALIATLLLMLLISAVAVALIYSATSEMSIGGSDREDMLAYYGAEAGMEKLMADVGTLYQSNRAPTTAQLTTLSTAPYQPAVSGIGYPEYAITPINGTDANGFPISSPNQVVSSGPYAGLTAQVIPLSLSVTSQRGTGNIGTSQARMLRRVQVALIPVFQFGVFSKDDLSYFPGPSFDFAGRVHTNGNLYLSAGAGSILQFHSKITAVNDVFRTILANTVDATTRTGTVNVPTAPNGCDGAQPACRALAQNEGSMINVPPVPNSGWTAISQVTYNSMIVNGATGAQQLNLPFVAAGVTEIEIIRRPKSTDNALTTASRLYNKAQIRVLLSDNPANLPGGANNVPGGTGDNQTIRLTQGGIPYPPGSPVINDTGVAIVGVGALNPTPFGQAGAGHGNDPNWFGAQHPLNPGYLRVEYKDAATGNYFGVTREWLNLGFARQGIDPTGTVHLGSIDSEHGGSTATNTVNPNAILILQQQNLSVGLPGEVPFQWYPINLYDTREGEIRDTGAGGSCAVNGVMSTIELDVSNLKKWLAGTIGTSGPSVENTIENGYILYFSDRRGMLLAGAETEFRGEYGWEDNINTGPTGTPDGILQPGEDANNNGVLDVYGAANIGNAFGTVPASDPSQRIATCTGLGAANVVTAPRHALKVVNGTLGNLPLRPGGTGGFTVASENPVYLKGNYNANDAGWGGVSPNYTSPGESAAAVIGDAATLLTNNWSDWNSLVNPVQVANRTGTQTWYRVAIAGGKNRTFPQPSGGWAAADYGTDGGVHNFLRYLENNSPITLHYRGSLVSFYNSQYGNGIYKCCTIVYNPPTRDYSFDVLFLNPQNMPPGTPRFQDVVNVGYRQDFTPR